MQNRVTVVLGGGIGNQLFQYFAGYYLARRHNSRLVVDSVFSQRSRTGHSDWIDVLKLPGSVSRDATRYSIRFLLAYTKRLLRGAFARVITTQEKQYKYLRQYRSTEVGYDAKLDLIKPPVTLIGYFQTWRFYESLKTSGVAPELRMTAVSDWYLEMSQLLENQGRVLGLHIRKGDYVANPTIGILSSNYYEAALKALRKTQVAWDAIWVFSDDVLAARHELSAVLSDISNVYFVEPPDQSHSFESLSLMSKTSALVIANSTFSWWAATLGEPSRTIVCPNKWFYQMEDPTDLCPPDWIRAEAHWV